MAELLYQTELDGMRKIAPVKEVSDNDFVYIKDDIYKDDITLFKNKKTSGNKLDLKMVKLAEIKTVSEEEQEKYKFNQLYIANDVVFTSQNRLSKNQMLQLGEKFYVVNNIIKHKDQPQELELTEIEYILATNMYAVYRRAVTDKEKTVFKMCSSYGEAIGVLWRMREKREKSYFYSL